MGELGQRSLTAMSTRPRKRTSRRSLRMSAMGQSGNGLGSFPDLRAEQTDVRFCCDSRRDRRGPSKDGGPSAIGRQSRQSILSCPRGAALRAATLSGHQLRRTYFPSDFSMSARFSSWFASAVQLREILFSTEDRRAEFVGSAPSFLYFAALALHCSTEII